MICVTGSPQVEALIHGEDGLAAAGKPLLDRRLFDLGAGGHDAPRGLAGARDIALIDAPLSRTPKDAWEGTLDVMVGGDPTAVARARPLSRRSPAASSRPGRWAPATR